MTPIAVFGIESSGLTLAVDLLGLFLVVLWGSLVYWTYADARRRIADDILVLCATGASLFPFVGTIIYMILRPPEYLEDVRERELDLQAAEARLHELDVRLCPHCDYRIERDFIRCPSCLRKLKERCTSCSRPLDRAWTICPYCETEVPAPKPARRARRERASAPETPIERTAGDTQPGDFELDLGAVEPEPAERPSRRRPPARAAVRAPEATSLLADASPETAAHDTLDSDGSAGENGKADPLAAEPLADPFDERAERPRSSRRRSRS